MKVKKGDTVKVMGGKDRGKTGTVGRVLPREDHLVVEGLNLAKKHRRPRRSGEAGQIVEFARAIAASRVMLVCPHCGKPTRVGVVRASDGSRVRRCRRCQATFV